MMDMFKKLNMKNWFISSQGEGLSLTIKGLSLIGIFTLLITTVGFLKMNIFENQYIVLICSISLIFFYYLVMLGILRKVYFEVKPFAIYFITKIQKTVFK